MSPKRSDKRGVDLVLDRAGISQVQDVDIVANLADPLHASLALFEPRWVPWQVDVDLGAEPLKVEALACRVGRADQPNIAVLDGRLDLLARGRAAVCSALNE